MTNLNRARRNAGKKARPAQSAKTQRLSQGKPPVADKISLIFISERDGTDIGGVDITAEEFLAIKKDAAARNETLPAWLCRVIAQTAALTTATPLLRSISTEPAAVSLFGALSNLDNIQGEMNFFVESVCAAMRTWNEWGSMSKERLGRMECGFMNLWRRLDGAMSEQMTAALDGARQCRKGGAQ